MDTDDSARMEAALMVRLSKNLLLNPAKVWIFGIKCSFDNIAKILDVFNFQWLAVTVDSVTAESPLLTLIKDHGFEYFVRPCSAGQEEISAVIPYSLSEKFLNKALNEDPENIFVFSLPDPANDAMCLRRPYEEAVAAGSIDVFISISLDENAVLICMNKSLIPVRDVYAKIKALRFD